MRVRILWLTTHATTLAMSYGFFGAVVEFFAKNIVWSM
jgi:hypothetical protein